MRKASMTVALALVALTTTARAQGPEPVTPVPPAAAPAAPAAEAVPLPPPPPALVAPAAVAAPAARPAAPAPVLVLPATTPTPPHRPLYLSASVLAMALGTFTAAPGGMRTVSDASFSYGFAVSAGYEILPGLSLGLSPQAIYNVGPKGESGPAPKEYDLFARVAYSVTLVESIALYVEALPGYSLILPPDGNSAKGFVMDFGGGVMMDLSDRAFVSVGVGYQMGFQKVTFTTMDPVTHVTVNNDVENQTKYTRVALSGGVRF